MTEAFNQICYSERGGEDCASTQMCVHMAMQSYAFAEANSTENGTSIEEDLYPDYYDPEDFMRNPEGEGLIEREGDLIEGEVTDPPSLREAPLREAPNDRELDVSLNSRSVEGHCRGGWVCVPCGRGLAAPQKSSSPSHRRAPLEHGR